MRNWHEDDQVPDWLFTAVASDGEYAVILVVNERERCKLNHLGADVQLNWDFGAYEK